MSTVLAAPGGPGATPDLDHNPINFSDCAYFYDLLAAR